MDEKEFASSEREPPKESVPAEEPVAESEMRVHTLQKSSVDKIFAIPDDGPELVPADEWQINWIEPGEELGHN